MIKTLLLTAMLWSTFCYASAGQKAVIWMKNGDRLTGTITQQDKDIVFLNLPYSGQVPLPRTQIDRIEQHHPVDAPDSEPAATPSVLVKNQPVRHYSVDLTAGKKRSSNDTDNLGFKTAFEQRDANLRLTFDAKYDYETSNALKKNHKYLVNPGLDYFFEPQLFWRNKVDYLQDFISSEYKNVDLSSGLGYSFYDTAEVRAELIALAGVKRAFLKETAGLELFIGDRQSIDFRHVQLEWDLRYLWAGSSFELFSEGSYLKPVNQPVNFIKFKQDINISSGLHYYLTERIRLSFSIDFDWSEIDVVLPRGVFVPVDSRDLHQKLSIGAKF